MIGKESRSDSLTVPGDFWHVNSIFVGSIVSELHFDIVSLHASVFSNDHWFSIALVWQLLHHAWPTVLSETDKIYQSQGS